MDQMVTTRQWTERERLVLDEARVKLRRKMNRNAVVAIAGALGTIASFAVIGGGGGIIFIGAILFGPIAALSASSNLKRLDTLRPGIALNARVLGVRTSADPPDRANRKVVAVLGAVIVLLLGFVVLAVLLH